MLSCIRATAWYSLFATILSAAGLILFSLAFDKAMLGFSKQVNSLIPIGSLGVRWPLILITAVFVIVEIFFLLIGVFSTRYFHRYESSQKNVQSISWKILAFRSIVGLSCLISAMLLFFWCLIVCFAAVCTAFYFVFIGATYSFCSFLDTRCFDFSVLLPAINRLLAKKDVNLVFCIEKKEVLCSSENNQLFWFFAALCCSLIALSGLIQLLMCLTSNYTRFRLAAQRRKGEHFALDRAGVMSGSFELSTMPRLY
ncbi:hypothetical protein AB6A40_002459 [Gnathostoma spinigerum]|uniref:Uncharacterized protein n=1 Tax=Gnathostoma spinigerum TaxID=75299 RepID=A0ABD6EHF0_9BILA